MLANLVQLLGPRAGQPEHYIEKSWAEEEWSRGCYEGYTPPGVLTAFGPALREPIGPIHWAGTETRDEVERVHRRRAAIGRARGPRNPRRTHRLPRPQQSV